MDMGSAKESMYQISKELIELESKIKTYDESIICSILFRYGIYKKAVI